MSVPEALDTFLSHLQIVEAEDADEVEATLNIWFVILNTRPHDAGDCWFLKRSFESINWPSFRIVNLKNLMNAETIWLGNVS